MIFVSRSNKYFKGGSIRNNELSIGNGTWYQAINVHHEADSVYRNVSPKTPKDKQPIPVSIVNNTIENNHDFAINAQHFNKIFSEPNTLNIKELENRDRVIKMEVRQEQMGMKK